MMYHKHKLDFNNKRIMFMKVLFHAGIFLLKVNNALI